MTLPPPPPAAPSRASNSAVLFLVGVLVAVCGRAWLCVNTSDWLALGIVGAALAARHPLFALAAAWGFWRQDGPMSLPGFEAMIAEVLGLSLLVAGAYLARWGARKDRVLAYGLLAAAAAVLAVAGAGRQAPNPWLHAATANLGARGTQWKGTGGATRWVGLLGVAAFWRLKKTSY